MPVPTTRELLLSFLKIGLLSFGGPAGQIAVLHRVVVEEKDWLDEEEFTKALQFCLMLPGPEAQQLVTWTGWKLGGPWIGCAAGTLFVLPGFLVMLGLSWLYWLHGDQVVVKQLFWGLGPVVVALVLAALIKISQKVLTTTLHKLISAMAFLGLASNLIPFPLVLLISACLGICLLPKPVNLAPSMKKTGKKTAIPYKSLIVWGLLWLLPLVLLQLVKGPQVLRDMAEFFAKTAVFSFGGAYALLAWFQQEAVHHFHWVSQKEMLHGLSLAETTPGPLILVVQFIGFLGAAHHGPGQATLSPEAYGAIASALACWMLFIPSFLWIFTLGPLMDSITQNRTLAPALSAMSAAVSGAILKVGLAFSVGIFFQIPERMDPNFQELWGVLKTLDGAAFILTILASIALIKFKAPLGWVMAFGAVLGLLVNWLFV